MTFCHDLFPNRSKAIQSAVENEVTGLSRTRLARECAKLEPQEEQRFVEEGMGAELTSWPEYRVERITELVGG